jgi:hypothetical protein
MTNGTLTDFKFCARLNFGSFTGVCGATLFVPALFQLLKMVLYYRVFFFYLLVHHFMLFAAHRNLFWRYPIVLCVESALIMLDFAVNLIYVSLVSNLSGKHRLLL